MEAQKVKCPHCKRRIVPEIIEQWRGDYVVWRARCPKCGCWLW